RKAPFKFPLYSFSSRQRTAAEPFRIQHQEGPGRRGSAQSYPAAPARGSALPPAGDTRRMGYRHTPEELGGARGVCGAGGGFVAAAEEWVGAHFGATFPAAMDAREKGGLKSAATRIAGAQIPAARIDERSIPVRAAL